MRLLPFLQLLAAINTAESSADSATKRLSREVEERWKRRLLRASEGNSKEYEQVLREMGDYLSIFCRRHLYSMEQVEDCVQECLLAIHRAKHTFNPQKPLGPWFFTIVRHKIIDQYRSRTKHRESERHDLQEQELRGKSALELDLAEEVQKLIPQLKEKERAAFRLCKLEGKSIAEAAKTLEITEGALKVQVHRASKRLKKLIREEFDKRY